jgi:capsular polysaccharide biosynthesis protein
MCHIYKHMIIWISQIIFIINSSYVQFVLFKNFYHNNIWVLIMFDCSSLEKNFNLQATCRHFEEKLWMEAMLIQ